MPKNTIQSISGKSNQEQTAVTSNPIRTKYQNILRSIKELINPIKVSFVIVGAQKSGTTALDHFLRQHPEVSMSKKKETDFFSTEKYWVNGEIYESYKKYFNAYFKKVKYGEASPSYMLNHEVVAPRIAKYNTDMKLIFILKNPIERAFSQYKMHVKRYNLNLSFRQCLDIAMNQQQENIRLDPSNQVTLNGSTKTIETYIKFGHYVEQIKSFQKYFGNNQILILLTEDLLNEHEQTMRKVYDFLDITPIDTKRKIVHSNKGQLSTTSKREREMLLKEYSQDIEGLEKILKRDLSHWKNI
jgi:hypothetical protein